MSLHTYQPFRHGFKQCTADYDGLVAQFMWCQSHAFIFVLALQAATTNHEYVRLPSSMCHCWVQLWCCPRRNSSYGVACSPTSALSWRPWWSPPAEVSQRSGMFSSRSWWKSARTPFVFGLGSPWMMLVALWSLLPSSVGLPPSAHGEAVHARLPPGQDARLLWEGGGAQSGRTATEVRCLQPVCVCRQGSDPHEWGKVSQQCSVRMPENTP